MVPQPKLKPKPSPLAGITLSKTRLEALADGLFAIVMTLLVLDLKVPDLPRHVDQQELLHKLFELGPVLFSFVITFLFASVFWFFHHLTFHFIRHVNRKLCLINVFFLMFVSLLPFTTAMMGHFMGRPLAMSLYFGNELVIAVMLWLHWRYAQRSGSLASDADPSAIRELSMRIMALPLGCTAALIVTPFFPPGAFYGFTFVLLVFQLIARKGRR